MADHFQWMFWSHEWQAVAVYERNQPFYDEDSYKISDDVIVPRTDVLYRCSCGKLKSVAVPGRWTLDQVNGNSSQNTFNHTKAPVET